MLLHDLRADARQHGFEQRLLARSAPRVFLLHRCPSPRSNASQSASEQRLNRSEVLREDLRHFLAHVMHAERVNEARERALLARLRSRRPGWPRISPPCARARQASARRARRDPPACARVRRRRADRRASRPDLRCPSRAATRSAGAPACAAPDSRGRRCSGRPLRFRCARPWTRRPGMRAASRTQARSGRGPLLEHHAHDLGNHVARAPHDRPYRRRARLSHAPDRGCAASRWSR